MTRRADLPAHDDVLRVVAELTEAAGKPPTVLAVAGRLGLSNTTFRRRFPEVAADLQQRRRRAGRAAADAEVTRFELLKAENVRLRRNNHELTEHLDLAVAVIQRQALEKQQLLQQLEAATRVTSIDPSRRR